MRSHLPTTPYWDHKNRKETSDVSAHSFSSEGVIQFFECRVNQNQLNQLEWLEC